MSFCFREMIDAFVQLCFDVSDKFKFKVRQKQAVNSHNHSRNQLVQENIFPLRGHDEFQFQSGKRARGEISYASTFSSSVATLQAQSVQRHSKSKRIPLQCNFVIPSQLRWLNHSTLANQSSRVIIVLKRRWPRSNGYTIRQWFYLILRSQIRRSTVFCVNYWPHLRFSSFIIADSKSLLFVSK